MSTDSPSVTSLVGSRPLICKLPWVTEEGLATAQSFRATPGDLFISTYPKTGTTCIQQILHQLRTGGHIDFDEISDEGVIPWLEISPSILVNVDAPQMAKPRCFKTHQMLSSLAHLERNDAKFLCTIRDPEKTLLSYFKFGLARKRSYTSARDINAFITSSAALGPDGWGEFPLWFGATLWDFYVEYWKCRCLPHVKLLVFEHLVSDLDSHLDGINSFMGLPPLEPSRRAVVLEYSSKEWMASHDHLFDDHHIQTRLARMGAEKQQEKVKKVGLEVPGDVILELNDESKAVLARMWKEKVQPVTGHASYSDMVADLT